MTSLVRPMPHAPEPLQLGVIGTGRISDIDFKNLAALDGLAIASCGSLDQAESEAKAAHHAITIEGFDSPDVPDLLARIRATRPTAHAVRGEDRLRHVEHYMSPKVWFGPIGLTLYHAASVPLNVGFHRTHPCCPVSGFRDVHMQIIGLGKMQQCADNDITTPWMMPKGAVPGTSTRP